MRPTKVVFYVRDVNDNELAQARERTELSLTDNSPKWGVDPVTPPPNQPTKQDFLNLAFEREYSGSESFLSLINSEDKDKSSLCYCFVSH
jgi:hypothetical protein